MWIHRLTVAIGLSCRRRLRLGRNIIALVIQLALAASRSPALADISAWSSTATTGTWQTSGNWVSGVIPGSTSVSNNVDTATFSSNSTTTTIVPDANRNLQNITFDGSAAAYTIGSTSGNAMLLTSGGTTQISGTFSGSNLTETVNAPLTLEGDYNFANNAGNSGDLLSVSGAITASGNVLRNITVAGTGDVAIGGSISGLNGGFAISKNGTGTLTLSADNNPSLNSLAVNDGVVRLGSSGALSLYGPASVSLNGVGTALTLAGNNITVSNLSGNGIVLNGGVAPASIFVAPGGAPASLQGK